MFVWHSFFLLSVLVSMLRNDICISWDNGVWHQNFIMNQPSWHDAVYLSFLLTHDEG